MNKAIFIMGILYITALIMFVIYNVIVFKILRIKDNSFNLFIEEIQQAIRTKDYINKYSKRKLISEINDISDKYYENKIFIKKIKKVGGNNE